MLPREALGHLNRSFPGFLTLPISAELDPFSQSPLHMVALASITPVQQRLQKKKKNVKTKQYMDRLQEDSRQFRNGDSGGESLGEGQRLGIPHLPQQPFFRVPP